MSGWNYPNDAERGPWDGPSYEPDRPTHADVHDPEEDFAKARQGYPRGYAPPWDGEDAPSEYGDPHYVDDDQSPDPDRFIHNPGFEEHRVGAILRQGEQYQAFTDLREAARDEGHYDDYDHALNDWEHEEAHRGG